MPSHVALLITALSASAGSPDTAALKALIEALAAPDGVVTHFVCVTISGSDLDTSEHRLELSQGRRLLPGSQCQQSGEFFIDTQTGGNALRIDLAKLDAQTNSLSATYTVRARDDVNCWGTIAVSLVDGRWVDQSDRTFTCQVE
jgi:hypothetical protein